ncbi:MAG: hypothetical protein U1D55_13205 [Phycisphaerae bacterium]
MLRLLDFLRIDDLPPRCRPNYLVELRHMALWGIFAGLVDGNTSSIVVAKTFGGSSLLVTIVWTSPLLAHLLSLIWSVLSRGRPRVAMYRWLALGAVASVLSVALTPSHAGPWAAWLFALQITSARIFVSGIVNVRSSIWQANYPQTHRARAAGKLQTLGFIALLITSATIGSLFDRNADYYVYIYPIIAVIGGISLLPLRRLRIRGERATHARARANAETARAGDKSLVAGLAEAWSILRNDKPFARYCSAQYLLGSASFMVEPVFTVFVTKGLKLSYLFTSVLLDHVPVILQLSTIRLWARYFDRVGVLRFRVVNGALWTTSAALACLGLMAHSAFAPTALVIALLALSRAAKGVGVGGGAIAWNLGHLQFAPPHQAELYMGIHVALTGLRGIIMPFVGMGCYTLLGWPSLGLATAVAASAALLFRRLANELPAYPQPVAAPALDTATAESEGID